MKLPADRLLKKIILFVFVLLMLLHLSFAFSGFYGNDDINYARLAADLVYNGSSSKLPADQFQLRWTTVYSTAFFYKSFGINAFTSALSSSVSFAFCGLLLYKMMRNTKPGVYLLTMTLFFCSHAIIFYMHRLLPDPAMCLAIFWMYHSYRSYLLTPKNPFLQALQFAVAFLLTVLTKETIIIAIPLFIVFFLKDILKKERLLFWKYAVLASLLFVVVYLCYFKITTGQFFYRYHVLSLHSYFNECSFDKLPFIYTLKRIGFELWRAMLLNGDFLVILPAVAALVYQKKMHQPAIGKMDAFSFLFLLCCANFMTISFTSYVPLCHDPRHFIFLLPFAAITGGPMIYAYTREPKRFFVLPLLFILATAIMFAIHAGTTKYLYLLFTLVLVAIYVCSYLKTFTHLHKFSIVSIVAVLFLNYLVDFAKPLFPYYWDHKKIIDKQFVGKMNQATVFSADAFSAELSEYFMGFQTGKVKFLPMDSVKSNHIGPVLYLLNGDLNAAAKMKMDSLVKINTDPRVFIIQQENNVFLYQVNDSLLQIIKK